MKGIKAVCDLKHLLYLWILWESYASCVKFSLVSVLVFLCAWSKKVHSRQSRTFAQNTSFAEKDLEVLQGREVGCDPAMCPVAKKVNGTLGYFRKSMASRWGRASLALVKAHLECCLQYETDKNILKLVHQIVKMRFKGLELHFYDERLRDLGMFILEKTRRKRWKMTTLEEAAFSGLLIKFTDSECKTVSPVSLCYAAENMYTLWFSWMTL